MPPSVPSSERALTDPNRTCTVDPSAHASQNLPPVLDSAFSMTFLPFPVLLVVLLFFLLAVPVRSLISLRVLRSVWYVDGAGPLLTRVSVSPCLDQPFSSVKCLARV